MRSGSGSWLGGNPAPPPGPARQEDGQRILQDDLQKMQQELKAEKDCSAALRDEVAQLRSQAGADFFVTLDGCRLPLQSAVLGAGCRALCQALATAGSAASAKEAAVQGVFNGQPLTHLQLFLRLLYGGSAGAAQGEDDPWSLAAIAHELDAPCVLQACDKRLVTLLSPRDPSGVWASWLALADRYSLWRLKPLAAQRALAHVLECYAQHADLGKLSGLSAGSYQLLLEAAVVTARNAQHALPAERSVSDLMPPVFARWSKLGDFL